jgi:hypothetical protein
MTQHVGAEVGKTISFAELLALRQVPSAEIRLYEISIRYGFFWWRIYLVSGFFGPVCQRM